MQRSTNATTQLAILWVLDAFLRRFDMATRGDHTRGYAEHAGKQHRPVRWTTLHRLNAVYEMQHEFSGLCTGNHGKHERCGARVESTRDRQAEEVRDEYSSGFPNPRRSHRTANVPEDQSARPECRKGNCIHRE